MSEKLQLSLPAGKSVPRHIALIMDGNNRWAKKHGKGSLAGHRAGVDSVRSVVQGCAELGVEVLTLFAFSSENWQRPPLEVKGLMELFAFALDREVKKLHKHNIRLHVIGDRSRFSQTLQKKISKAEQMTAENTGLIVNVAANYGGRWDIVEAAKCFAQGCLDGQYTPDQLDADLLGSMISLSDQPAPDLCIRTAGEQRISNFLIWQMAYSEYFFSDLLWPDFDKYALGAAIQSYATRERRFGKTSEQLEADDA
ncbi:MAG: di-trans,poly-cis-decaprenylcistransferase [Amphritea sp.]|nr:di-trans,poly-cis-decaprenylcistransferase [Amphritea sp.]MBQ0782915.1 di-trans,poly-cis-decaprenylcistransferase [Amphritea sp.]